MKRACTPATTPLLYTYFLDWERQWGSQKVLQDEVSEIRQQALNEIPLPLTSALRAALVNSFKRFGNPSRSTVYNPYTRRGPEARRDKTIRESAFSTQSTRSCSTILNEAGTYRRNGLWCVANSNPRSQASWSEKKTSTPVVRRHRRCVYLEWCQNWRTLVRDADLWSIFVSFHCL